jgi:hypothetical protein
VRGPLSLGINSHMRSFVQFLVEGERKNFRADGVFHRPIHHLDAPEPGSPLYHITASHYEDDSKFHEKSSHPVTWFTSGAKDYNGHKEIAASFHEGTSAGDPHQRIHIRTMNEGVKLANEHDVHVSMAATRGGKPEDYKGEPVYSALDKNVGEYSHEHIDSLVRHLKGRGFHGVVHADFSMVNPNRDMHSVALFEPNRHTTYVRTVRDPSEVEGHQREYEKGKK